MAHAVVDTSVATGSALPGLHGRFERRKCKHEQLFLPSYLRTNRTNHTKIMRCFPHCCPCHRQRSYCGSPVFFQLDQAHGSREQLDVDRLVVFARFRPVHTPALVAGDRASLPAIEASLQRDDPSTGEWIEAELSHSSVSPADGSVAYVFEVNPSGRWYYPWSGAATIALRATEHVFEVLAFKRETHTDLKLLATAVSSKFRLMSFRRGAAASTSTDATATPQAKRKDDNSDSSSQSSPKPTRNPVLPGKRARPSSSSTAIPAAVFTSKAPHFPGLSRQESQPRAPSPTTTTPLAVAPVRPHCFESASESGSSLATLLQWLQELPISSVGSRRLKEWEDLVLDACVAHKLSSSGAHSHPGRGLVPILSALQVQSSMSYGQSGFALAPSPLDTIDATVRVFLHLFLDVESCRAASSTFSSQLTHYNLGTASSRSDLEVTSRQWTREVENQASHYVRTRTKVSWDHLMATVATLRDQHRVAPVNDCFGYQAFVAQTRERFVQRLRCETEVHKSFKRRRVGMTVTRKPEGATSFDSDARVWTCRMEDLSIEMDGMAQHSLSLLTVMHFWRHLSCLRLHFDRDHTQTLSIASVFNSSITDGCFSKLTLDGQYRWLSCLPNGDATTGTSLMGFVVGDYVGRATSAGTIHVTTFLWPHACTQFCLAYAWHWTIDASAIADENQSVMVVSVIVESAPVTLSDSAQFETMSVVEKLRCIGRWTHVSQVQLTYRA